MTLTNDPNETKLIVRFLEETKPDAVTSSSRQLFSGHLSVF